MSRDNNGYNHLPGSKIIKVTVRYSEKDFYRLEHLAEVYCEGNISEWVRQTSVKRYVPKLSKKKALDLHLARD